MMKSMSLTGSPSRTM
uniref:Uncharacterized protein n=1 Tax=Zea mays TaxID=4577 RepID=C4J8E4_MAIZE|nr:unknown [Zea mays]